MKGIVLTLHISEPSRAEPSFLGLPYKTHHLVKRNRFEEEHKHKHLSSPFGSSGFRYCSRVGERKEHNLHHHSANGQHLSSQVSLCSPFSSACKLPLLTLSLYTHTHKYTCITWGIQIKKFVFWFTIQFRNSWILMFDLFPSQSNLNSRLIVLGRDLFIRVSINKSLFVNAVEYTLLIVTTQIMLGNELNCWVETTIWSMNWQFLDICIMEHL